MAGSRRNINSTSANTFLCVSFNDNIELSDTNIVFYPAVNDIGSLMKCFYFTFIRILNSVRENRKMSVIFILCAGPDCATRES
jgi:hypothetical protein